MPAPGRHGIKNAAKVFGLGLHGFMIALAIGLTRFIWSYPYGDHLIPISRAEEEMTRYGATAIIWFLCLFPPPQPVFVQVTGIGVFVVCEAHQVPQFPC